MEGKRTGSVNNPKNNLTKGNRHRKTLGRRLEQLIAIAMALLVFINVPLSALADEPDLPVPAAKGGESAVAAAGAPAEATPTEETAAEAAAAQAETETAAEAPATTEQAAPAEGETPAETGTATPAEAETPAPTDPAPAAPAETVPDTAVTDSAQTETPAVPEGDTQETPNAAQDNSTEAVNPQTDSTTPPTEEQNTTPATGTTEGDTATEPQETPADTPAKDSGTADGTPATGATDSGTTADPTPATGTTDSTATDATGATDDAATDDPATGASGDSGSSASEDAALSTTEDLTQVQTIRTYVFLVDGEEFASVAITNGDVLYDPGIPEAEDGGQFEGWFDGESRLSFGTVDDIPEGTEETREILARFTEKPYPAQSFSARAGFLRIEVTADEGTFPENTTMKAVSVSKAKAIEAAQEAIDADPSRDEEVVDALAVDITFYNEEGEEIQPVNPSGVHVTLTALREIKGESQDVAHIAEGGQSTIISSADVSGDTKEKADGTTAASNVTASFDAEHFSVYAIIGTEGYKTDDTIRRTYIFYSDHEEEGVFTEWSRQIVKNGDILLEPALPTKTNQYFIGWYAGKDHSLGNADVEMHFGTVDDITGTLDSEGKITDEVVEVHAHFSAEYAVRLYEHFGGNYEIIEIKEAMPGTVVSLAGVYSRNLENNQQISSWSLVDANFQPLGTTYSTTDSVTLGTEDIYLLANIESIYKIEFYVNHTEALKNDETRAHSVLPVYVPDGGSAAAYMPAAPTRTGYTFGGWYMEETCVNAFDPDALLTETQDAADGTVNYVVRLYAKWVPSTVSYEVFVWHEILNDDGTDPERAQGEKKYAVAFSYTGTAPAGAAVNAASFQSTLNAQCGKAANSALIPSAYYQRNQKKLNEALQSLVPEGDGSTIFHVYYDLKVFSLVFRTWEQEYADGVRFTPNPDPRVTIQTVNDSCETYTLRAKRNENIYSVWPEVQAVYPTDDGRVFFQWKCQDESNMVPQYIPVRLEDRTISLAQRGNLRAVYKIKYYTRRQNFYFEPLDNSPAAAGDRKGRTAGMSGTLGNTVFRSSSDYTEGEYAQQDRKFNGSEYRPLSYYGTLYGYNGFTGVHINRVEPDLLEYYYTRNRHNLIFHNYDKSTSVSGIQFDAPIEGYFFTPDYKDTSLADLGVVYEFGGWYTDRAHQNLYDATGKTMPDNNLELFAKWEPKTVTLTFDGNGAKFDEDDVAGYEDRSLSEDKTQIRIKIPAGTKLGSVNVPEAPDLPRFHFRDWIVNGHSVNFDNRVFTDDTVIKANWGAEHYVKVQYRSAEKGGEVLALFDGANKTEREYSYGSHILMLTPPANLQTSKEGKPFVGWRAVDGGRQTYLPTELVAVTPGAAMIQETPGDGDDLVTFYPYYETEKPEEMQVSILYHSNYPKGQSFTDQNETWESEGFVVNHGTTAAAGPEIFALHGTDVEGYNFIGWNTSKDGTGITFAPGAEISADRLGITADSEGNWTNELWALWEASSGVTFTIRHYGKAVGSDTYELLTEPYTRFGTADDEGTAVSLSFDGFTFDKTTTETKNGVSVAEESDGHGGTRYRMRQSIAPDGTTVFDFYYTRQSYTLNYSYTSTDNPAGQDLPASKTVAFGETVTVDGTYTPGMQKYGYTFSGWSQISDDFTIENGAFTMPARDVTLQGAWVPASDTTYTVNYYGQKIGANTAAQTDFELLKSVTLTGSTGQTVIAPQEIFEGFAYNESVTNNFTHMSPPSGVITADEDGIGTLVLNLYYGRESYNVTYQYTNTPKTATVKPDATAVRKYKVTVPYGATFQPGWTAWNGTTGGSPMQKVTASGYRFSGWKTNFSDYGESFKMPARDVVLSGTFSVESNTAYKVEHYFQKLNEAGTGVTDDYEIGKTETLHGETDSTAQAVPGAFEGYTFDSGNGNNKMSGTVAGTGGLVLKLYYKRNTNPVTYAYTNTVPGATDLSTYTDSCVYGQKVYFKQNPTADGYVFGGWSVAGSLAVESDEGGRYFTMPDRGVTVSGGWTAATNTPYTIEYYHEKLERSNKAEYVAEDFELVTGRTVDGKGTTGALVEAGTDNVEGFTFSPEATQKLNGAVSGQISADGKLVLKVYYTRNTHTVTYEYTNHVPGETDISGYVHTAKYGEEISFEAPATAPGYDFGGWHVTDALAATNGRPAGGPAYEGFVMPDRNVTVSGAWTAGDVSYTVKHILMDLQGKYTIEDPETKTGQTGTNVTAAAKSYEGFAYNDTKSAASKSGEITAHYGQDGTTAESDLVLTLYYDRRQYEVSYHYNNTVPGMAPSLEALEAAPYRRMVYYGDEVSFAPAATSPGYDFGGWSITKALAESNGRKEDGGTTYTGFTMPARNVTVSGSWMAGDNTEYTVEYFLMNVDGTGYTKDESRTVTREGTTGTTAIAQTGDIEGFTYSRSATERQGRVSGEIAGNGSLVLQVYYDRNQYNVAYQYSSDVAGESALPATRKYYYGARVTFENDATAAGYTFSGWSVSGGVGADATGFVMPAEDVTVTGSWTAETVTYKVWHHFAQTGGGYELLHWDGSAMVPCPGHTVNATAGSAVSVGVEAFEGYTVNDDETALHAPSDSARYTYGATYDKAAHRWSGTAAGDGSLEFHFYYDQNPYTLTYAYSGTTPAGVRQVPAAGTYHYGDKIYLDTEVYNTGAVVNGYTFDG